jgi:hypothetical protein
MNDGTQCQMTRVAQMTPKANDAKQMTMNDARSANDAEGK